MGLLRKFGLTWLVLAGFLAWCRAPLASAQESHDTFEEQLREIRQLGDATALDKLEVLLAQHRDEAQRRSCYRQIKARLTKYDPPPPSAAEERLLQTARAESDHAETLLLGRHTITLVGGKYAEEAKACEFTTNLDLAYLALREVFSVDPVKRCGHRFVIWFPHNKANGWTTNGETLRVWVGVAQAGHPNGFFDYVHEFGHAFLWDFRGNPIFAGGFGEGWCDFCKVIAAERLAFLGPPFADEYPRLLKAFRQTGRLEHLNTRLPIEHIVAYAPSTSVLVELLERTRPAGGVLDWKPLERLMADLAADQVRRPPGFLWPAWQADAYKRYFASCDVTEILRRYRFPPDGLGNWSLFESVGRADAATTVRQWRVLGPIPDPKNDRLRDDPLDLANFVVRDSYELDGRTYHWQSMTADARGVLELGQLAGARKACRFYLVGNIPSDGLSPAVFYISSDDDAEVWLDGALLHVFQGNRGTNPRDPDRALGQIEAGKIVALVANRGGPTGFHLRVDVNPSYRRIYPTMLKDGDVPQRRGLVEYLGSRILDGGLATPLLVKALRDADAQVRARAAWGLGGVRNDVEVVDHLLAAWSEERDAEASSALRDAVNELTLRSFDSASAAQRWWKGKRPSYAEDFFVECERAMLYGDVRGGFYGNQEGACGGQTIDRGWGGGPDDELRLRLKAPHRGCRRLVIRYRAASDCQVRIQIKHGASVVYDRKGVKLSRATGTGWRRAFVNLPELDAGWYSVMLSESTGRPVLDVIGWTAEEQGNRGAGEHVKDVTPGGKLNLKQSGEHSGPCPRANPEESQLPATFQGHIVGFSPHTSGFH